MSLLFDHFLFCRRHSGLVDEVLALKRPEGASALAGRIRQFLIDSAASKGFSGQAMTRLISAFNDQLTGRIIEIAAQQHRLPPVDWCWLALGSEGRHEQTFVSDQDNGLVFNAADSREANALRALFLPFAQEVNQRLADCGFKLCPGQIMAGNPAWCLSLDEWRSQFVDWVRRPEPAALLNGSIFFDLRPMVGTLELGEKLRSLLLALTADTPAFLHLMAANALQAEVPLNFRGEVTAGDGGVLDLKKYGSRIFVDAARIFALASGVRSVHTGERLRETAPKVGLSPDEAAAVDAAFSHILRLRLDQQLADLRAGADESYCLKISALHEMDKAVLRESLKQARRLQLRLKLNYSL